MNNISPIQANETNLLNYRNILKSSYTKERKSIKHFSKKQNSFKKFEKINGMESDNFDIILDKDIQYNSNKLLENNKKNSTVTVNVETIRRLNLIKIAKQVKLNRNIYFNLFQKNYDGYTYTNKSPNNLEEFELRRLFSRQRYIQFLNKSLIVNDIRDKVFIKIASNLNISQEKIDLIKFKTQHIDTATSSSNAILSHNGSHNQERVKDIRLRQNTNFEKYQHNSKWIIFNEKNDKEEFVNSSIYQLPKMNGKFHTEFCLKYFIANSICEGTNEKQMNSLYTMKDILNILLNIREYYQEYFLKILKDNVINVFEGLTYDMQCLLCPSLDNIKNVDRANAIRKIINLGISRENKINKLYLFTYVNKYKEVIKPFDINKKFRLILNSSYHYVKDTNLKSTLDNPNCIANTFLSKFKISFGIYEVSDSFILYKNFNKLNKNNFVSIIKIMSNLILNTYLVKDNFEYAIQSIQTIKNETFSLNKFSSITGWFRQYIEITPISLSLYANMFPNTQNIMVNIYKKYKKNFKTIVNKEITLKKKMVNDFLKSKQCSNKTYLMNGILKYNHYTHDIQFQTNVIELLNDLNIVSISYMEKYFEIYVNMIIDSPKLEGYILFNHMIQRFIYFIDTKCYTDEFNIKYQQTNLKRNHAFPMFSKFFSQIIKKKKYKPSDSLEINNHVKFLLNNEENNACQREQDISVFDDEENNSELEFELFISDDEDED